MKCIEVRLDYEQVMQRLQFRVAPLPDAATDAEKNHAHQEQVWNNWTAWVDYLKKEEPSTADR